MFVSLCLSYECDLELWLIYSFWQKYVTEWVIESSAQLICSKILINLGMKQSTVWVNHESVTWPIPSKSQTNSEISRLILWVSHGIIYLTYFFKNPDLFRIKSSDCLSESSIRHSFDSVKNTSFRRELNCCVFLVDTLIASGLFELFVLHREADILKDII